MEYLDLFDQTGQLIGSPVAREELGDRSQLGDAFVKVVHGIPVNSAGAVLVQQRALTKAIWPGRWALLGGHVDAGETAEASLLREFREEYGIDASTAPRAMVLRLIQRVAHALMEFWLILIDVDVADVVCQADEVAQVGYRTPAELVEIYQAEDRWAPGEAVYRDQVLELFRSLPEVSQALRAEVAR